MPEMQYTHEADAGAEYSTFNIEVAAYLLALGHEMTRTTRATPGQRVTFHFPIGAENDARNYWADAPVPARSAFEKHRGLRALISRNN